MHLDLWPCLTFRGHFKVTNVKIACIFLMVRYRHVVNMNHIWEVDIWLSLCPHKFYLRWPWQGYFKATKEKIACASHRWEMDRNLLSDVYVHLMTLTVAKIDLAPWVGHPYNSWASCTVWQSEYFFKASPYAASPLSDRACCLSSVIMKWFCVHSA